jgi:hypothetical protein
MEMVASGSVPRPRAPQPPQNQGEIGHLRSRESGVRIQPTAEAVGKES